MIRHDFQCPSCHKIREDVPCNPVSPRHQCLCGSEMEILWRKGSQAYIGIHPSDRAVVWYNPKTGKHATPMRNDLPMPDRYQKWGYERKEFSSLRELDSFCSARNIINDASYSAGGDSRSDFNDYGD